MVLGKEDVEIISKIVRNSLVDWRLFETNMDTYFATSKGEYNHSKIEEAINEFVESGTQNLIKQMINANIN